jgi:osmotically inducible protein OsmC
MPVRKAEAEWKGGLKDGKGNLKVGSGAFDLPYSFRDRFEDGKGTNPEELIGAAHAGCFSMAMSKGLADAGFTPVSIDTTANVHLEAVNGQQTVTRIDLNTTVNAPGIDNDTFQKIAEGTKQGCPISRLLAPGTEITLTATLAS